VTITVGRGHFQCPSRPRDVACPGYSPVSNVGPRGLDGGRSPPGMAEGGAGLRRGSVGLNLGSHRARGLLPEG
jgi:hypothetical protein